MKDEEEKNEGGQKEENKEISTDKGSAVQKSPLPLETSPDAYHTKPLVNT